MARSSDSVIPMLDGIPRDTSSTVILLTSPQKLAKEKCVCDALLLCTVAGTLRLVAIDEVHLYTMHGRTFRDSIRYLRDNFFHLLVEFSILFLAMTATMSANLLKDLFCPHACGLGGRASPDVGVPP